MTMKEWKQAVVSLVIGTLISAITIFLQGLIELLQNIPTEAPGTIGGMAYFIIKSRLSVYT